MRTEATVGVGLLGASAEVHGGFCLRTKMLTASLAWARPSLWQWLRALCQWGEFAQTGVRMKEGDLGGMGGVSGPTDREEEQLGKKVSFVVLSDGQVSFQLR